MFLNFLALALVARATENVNQSTSAIQHNLEQQSKEKTKNPKKNLLIFFLKKINKQIKRVGKKNLVEK